MKSIKPTINIFFLFVVSLAQAKGPDVTRKTLELSNFSSIYVNSNYTVYLKQTNKQEVTVEVLTEIYDISEFKVESGTLHINIQKKPKDPNATIWSKIDNFKISPTMNVYISVRDISTLKVNGGGKIISENSISSNNLDLAVNGSGSMELDIKGREIKTKLTGEGSLTLKGYGSTNEIVMGGSGSLNAFDCELTHAIVELSGSGTCELNVSDDLKATVYGDGSIKHKGATKTVTKKEYGRGEVARAY